ncbi:hypothetical protein [Chryseobacterium sp. Leaf180]|jgi:hypothetical protein|nr:hypothetical protein [Chryseobacterium sp. Leaf180]
MKNIVKDIEKILKEDDNIDPRLKADLQKKKEIISKDKTVRK